MSKKKPESLTERQHFLLYEYKFTWWKLTSRKDAQDNQDQRYKLADLTRDYWRPKDRVYVLLVWLLLCCSLTLPGQILCLIWGRGWFNPFSSPAILLAMLAMIYLFQISLAIQIYRYKFLRKRLQEEWKDVPVIGEDGEPISKVEEQTHA